MPYDPEVWGPHYWFFLHTIAHAYPAQPNEVLKKKYYNFYHDLPLFIPIAEVGNNVAKLIDKYPVSPYLESRHLLIRWTHFIHNKINTSLEKEPLTLPLALRAYHKQYTPPAAKNAAEAKFRNKVVFAATTMTVICAAAALYVRN